MSDTSDPTVNGSTPRSEAFSSSSLRRNAGNSEPGHCAGCRLSIAYSASLLLLSLALASSPILDGAPVSDLDIPRSA